MSDTKSAIAEPVRKLLQDIRYEMQRVMMGARWERAYFTALLERIGEALKSPLSQSERIYTKADMEAACELAVAAYRKAHG